MTLSVATPAAAPWRQCHASTIIEGAERDLLLAFFAGTREGTDDNAIYLVRGVARHPGAADRAAGVATDSWSWSEPAQLTDVVDAHWNPVLGRCPLGKLTLFFKRGRPISRWQTWRMTSQSDGHTWSPADELVPGDRGGRGPVRNPPLVLSSGRWVAGASTEAAGSGGVTSVWDCFADFSHDDGVTWTRSEAGDPTATEAAQRHVSSVVGAVGPTITRLKYALSTRYHETWGARMPLPAVDQEIRTVIDALL